MTKLTETRKDALAWLAGHGTLFRRDVMNPGVAKALEAAGYLTSCPGRNGRLCTVTITDAGRAVVAGVPCTCHACSKKRGEL
jgi:hypothetical protein